MELNEKTARAQIRRKITKKLVSALLDIVLLVHFQDEDFGARDAIMFIRERFSIMMSPQKVYSTIYEMEREKLLEGFYEEGKKMYRVTELGKSTVKIATSSGEMQAFMLSMMVK